jgi:hypothetical protein
MHVYPHPRPTSRAVRGKQRPRAFTMTHQTHPRNVASTPLPWSSVDSSLLLYCCKRPRSTQSCTLRPCETKRPCAACLQREALLASHKLLQIVTSEVLCCLQQNTELTPDGSCVEGVLPAQRGAHVLPTESSPDTLLQYTELSLLPG